MYVRVKESLGRRGLLLLLGGLAWAALGIDLLRHDRRFTPSYPQHWWNVILNVINNNHWGWMWIICGVGAAIIGCMRQTKLLYGRDAAGFSLMALPSMVWALFSLWSVIVALITHGHNGRLENVYDLVVWLLITAFVMVCAGWPEPPRSMEAITRVPPKVPPGVG